MSAPLLVGITGKKRHGKSTFAGRLSINHGFTVVSLADPMRRALELLDPFVVEQGYALGSLRLSETLRLYGGWEDVKDSEYGPEIRGLLQRFGTEVGRNLWGEDFWVDQARRLIEDTDGPVVVPDVRFDNEVAMIRGLGGVLVHVYRPELSVSAHDGHISEQLNGFAVADLIVPNTSIEHLYRHADTFAAARLRYLKETPA